MMRQFRTDADVVEYFEQQARFGTMPDPPPDLWEQMDSERRSHVRSRNKHPLTEPDLTALPCLDFKPMQKSHPVRLIERLHPVPNIRSPMRKTYVLKPVP